MGGLTFEKLIVIGIIAAVIIGPERLPRLASQLASLVKRLRAFADDAKGKVRDEFGDDLPADEWRKLDPRQYDPRRIIRDAWEEAGAERASAAPTPKPAAAAAVPLPAETASASASEVSSPTPGPIAKRATDGDSRPDWAAQAADPEPVGRPPFDDEAT